MILVISDAENAASELLDDVFVEHLHGLKLFALVLQVVELITELELVFEEFFPLLGKLFSLTVLDMDLAKLIEEALLSLEFVHGTSLGFDLFLYSICLVDKIVINLDEFRILNLIDMRAFPKIQSILFELLFSHLILKLLLPLGVVFFVLRPAKEGLCKLLVESVRYGFLKF